MFSFIVYYIIIIWITNRYKIHSYFKENYHLIPGQEIYNFLKNEKKIANIDKVLLLDILAQKQYKLTQVLDMAIDILMNADVDANIYLKIEKTLAKLQTEEAYEILKNINPEIKLQYSIQAVL